MAERRMFAKSVVQQDAFIEMPLSAQALFFHLGMEADDDGFLDNAKRVLRSICAADDDMRILLAKGFVVDVGDGVFVLRHWLACNRLRSDRYKLTAHTEKSRRLRVNPDKTYSLLLDADAIGIPTDIPTVDACHPQYRLGKDSIELVESKEIQNTQKKRESKRDRADKPPALPRGKHGYVRLTDDEYNRLVADFGAAEVARLIACVDEKAAITENKNRWKCWNLVIRKAQREGWHVAPAARTAPHSPLQRRLEDATGLGVGSIWDDGQNEQQGESV